TPFEQIVLLLQGGGALGSYQAGVYQALAEADLHPNWVAGISIGAINAAIIAGNAPDKRVDRLREFWEAVSTSPLGIPYFKSIELQNAFVHQLVNQGRAVSILLFGDPNFFTPRVPLSMLWPAGTPDKASYYDTTPLKATLERLVDFDRINAGSMRFSVGAVNVGTGNFVYFDTTTHRIRPEHVMASGSLPPGFPATEVDKILQQAADEKVCNIVHLIYRARSYEGIAKDFEFSRRTMREHWASGYDDARRTLA